jgi:hypothetical protein
MATKKRNIPRPAGDPAAAANQQVLEEREQRILASMPPPVDLGLDLQEKEPQNAAEFLTDEWDRKAFGDPVATIKKTVFGPDSLVDQSAALKASLEKFGKQDYAAATAEAIMRKGAMAVPDAVLQRGLRAAIARFGKEAVAAAFYDRIMKIPVREVEIDASDVLDPMIMGSNVLRDTVDLYKRPGYAYKFLSQRCIDTLGMRGYTLVKDDRGEVVKAGTLMLGEIRQEIADARRARFAAESEQEVREIEEAYRDALARPDANFNYRGAKAEGIIPVGEGDSITAGATESEDYLGETRRGGVRVDRQAAIERRLQTP